MMIKVTPEMEAAASAAWGPEWITGDMHGAIEAVLKIVDRDYVPRWAWIRETLPREALYTHGVVTWMQEMVQERAKYMGGTVEDVTKFEIENGPFHSGLDQVVLKWKVRRD